MVVMMVVGGDGGGDGGDDGGGGSCAEDLISLNLKLFVVVCVSEKIKK